MKVVINKKAIKDLKRIDFKMKDKIHSQFLELKKFPNLPNIKSLTNFTPKFRLRVGDYRILFDVIDETVEILRVLNRKESYK